ncbi:uncharacterized protein BCR38DRAFT_407622 [Pseudomassariella vexata]|uniref:Uncharacterized protein n=1 Tax=Pseudomassariella vexata TaxID=1141098 RepID=A0A1Y2E804_9PEZI|nr:uncharacterized protein BCR38DRAFT_407622 [Pseudomassariella vexata]ORY67669.1 hypothetical protein BCR38DRAFT_407622 [Pseudomassariella vexata]
MANHWHLLDWDCVQPDALCAKSIESTAVAVSVAAAVQQWDWQQRHRALGKSRSTLDVRTTQSRRVLFLAARQASSMVSLQPIVFALGPFGFLFALGSSTQMQTTDAYHCFRILVKLQAGMSTWTPIGLG